MLLGAVTYNILKDWDLETIITKLEEARFTAVELRTQHKHGVEPTLTSAERKKVADRFARSKVRLLSFGSTCEFHSADPAVRRKHIDDAKKFIDLALQVGATALLSRDRAVLALAPRARAVGLEILSAADWARCTRP